MIQILWITLWSIFYRQTKWQKQKPKWFKKRTLNKSNTHCAQQAMSVLSMCAGETWVCSKGDVFRLLDVFKVLSSGGNPVEKITCKQKHSQKSAPENRMSRCATFIPHQRGPDKNFLCDWCDCASFNLQSEHLSPWYQKLHWWSNLMTENDNIDLNLFE